MDARSLFASGSRLLAVSAMSLSLIVPMPAFAADAEGGDDVGTSAQLAVDGDFVNFRWHLRTGSGFSNYLRLVTCGCGRQSWCC